MVIFYEKNLTLLQYNTLKSEILMPIIFRFFFATYDFVWKIAILFLRRHKRLKEGWVQRNIPDDWLTQNSSSSDSLSTKDKDKPFFGKKNGHDSFSFDDGQSDEQYDVHQNENQHNVYENTEEGESSSFDEDKNVAQEENAPTFESFGTHNKNYTDNIGTYIDTDTVGLSDYPENEISFRESDARESTPHSHGINASYAKNVSQGGDTSVDLWIQAASGGEAYLACEFIRALPQEKRDMSILITTWTRQGMQVLSHECSKIIADMEAEALLSPDTFGDAPNDIKSDVESEETNVEQGQGDDFRNLLSQENVARDNAENNDEAFSANSEQNPKSVRIPFIQIRFAPLDKKDIVMRALDIANPRLCVMLETELWPNFMLGCKEREIPFYVINGRMTKTTYEFYRIIAKVLNFVSPKHVLAMTQDDMQRFSTIFPSALVSYMPNIKFDRAAEFVRDSISKFQEKSSISANEKKEGMGESEEWENKTMASQSDSTQSGSAQSDPAQIAKSAMPKKSSAKKTKKNFVLSNETGQNFVFPSERGQNFVLSGEEVIKKDVLIHKTYLKALPMLFSQVQSTLLFASVREEEENLLASILWKLYPVKKNSLFIVAPRHMHRVGAWKKRFYDLGMRPLLASEFLRDRDFSDETRSYSAFESHYCVIWDLFGDLTHLYSHADTVFVGGSFKGLGGQNFLEALSCGAIPHVGPDLDNFLWALGEDVDPSLEDMGLLYKHKNKRDLQLALLQSRDYKKQDKERFDIQMKFLEWIEPRCGASKLAVEKILADRAFNSNSR